MPSFFIVFYLFIFFFVFFSLSRLLTLHERLITLLIRIIKFFLILIFSLFDNINIIQVSFPPISSFGGLLLRNNLIINIKSLPSFIVLLVRVSCIIFYGLIYFLGRLVLGWDIFLMHYADACWTGLFDLFELDELLFVLVLFWELFGCGEILVTYFELFVIYWRQILLLLFCLLLCFLFFILLNFLLLVLSVSIGRRHLL